MFIEQYPGNDIDKLLRRADDLILYIVDCKMILNPSEIDHEYSQKDVEYFIQDCEEIINLLEAALKNKGYLSRDEKIIFSTRLRDVERIHNKAVGYNSTG